MKPFLAVLQYFGAGLCCVDSCAVGSPGMAYNNSLRDHFDLSLSTAAPESRRFFMCRQTEKRSAWHASSGHIESGIPCHQMLLCTGGEGCLCTPRLCSAHWRGGHAWYKPYSEHTGLANLAGYMRQVLPLASVTNCTLPARPMCCNDNVYWACRRQQVCQEDSQRPPAQTCCCAERNSTWGFGLQNPNAASGAR